MKEKVLELINVNKSYLNKSAFGKSSEVHILKNVTFSIGEGQTLGLVGESGSGKTTTTRLILKQETPSSGQILFNGKNIFMFNKQENASYRRQVQTVYQDPYSSLDPSMKIKDIIAEPLVISKQYTKQEINDKVVKVMSKIGLATDHLQRYPREFSGGQRQRIAMARAMIMSPKLLILDEPVSALDVSIRGQILNLLKSAQQANKTTYIYISHDIGSVGYLSDSIAVMYFGYIVEYANTSEVLNHYHHPYTEMLLKSNMTTSIEIEEDDTQAAIEPPSHINPPDGCPYRARCKYAEAVCEKELPPLREINSGHFTACHRAGELSMERIKQQAVNKDVEYII